MWSPVDKGHGENLLCFKGAQNFSGSVVIVTYSSIASVALKTPLGEVPELYGQVQSFCVSVRSSSGTWDRNPAQASSGEEVIDRLLWLSMASNGTASRHLDDSVSGLHHLCLLSVFQSQEDLSWVGDRQPSVSSGLHHLYGGWGNWAWRHLHGSTKARRLTSLDLFVGVTNLESIILLWIKESAHWSESDSDFQDAEAYGLDSPLGRHYREGGGTPDSCTEEQTLHTARLPHKPRASTSFQGLSPLVLVLLFISFSMILSDVLWVMVIVADNKSISEVYNFGDERALNGFIIQMRK